MVRSMYVLLLFPEGVPGDWIGDGHAVVAGDPFIWVVAGHREAMIGGALGWSSVISTLEFCQSH